MVKIRSEHVIVKSWRKEISRPLVSICCIAYNHEAFIEDAIKGFLIQETDFPFEILIHDDASTDKTANIIKKYEALYPNLIKPIYQQENKHSQGEKINLEYNFPRAKGKYIAICEGDDYWISGTKLQDQVNFLEENLSYIGVSHYTHIHYEKDAVTSDNRKSFTPKVILRKKDLFSGWVLHVNSLVFRNLFQEMIKWDRNVFMDKAFLITLSNYGKIGSIPKFMSVYRVHGSGQTALMHNSLEKSYARQNEVYKALRNQLKLRDLWGLYYLKSRLNEEYLIKKKIIEKKTVWSRSIFPIIGWFVVGTIITVFAYPRNLKSRYRKSLNILKIIE